MQNSSLNLQATVCDDSGDKAVIRAERAQKSRRNEYLCNRGGDKQVFRVMGNEKTIVIQVEGKDTDARLRMFGYKAVDNLA
jgi:hypothetical protein